MKCKERFSVKATCMCKIDDSSFAVGFENSIVLVYCYSENLKVTNVLDHGMPNAAI